MWCPPLCGTTFIHASYLARLFLFSPFCISLFYSFKFCVKFHYLSSVKWIMFGSSAAPQAHLLPPVSSSSTHYAVSDFSAHPPFPSSPHPFLFTPVHTSLILLPAQVETHLRWIRHTSSWPWVHLNRRRVSTLPHPFSCPQHQSSSFDLRLPLEDKPLHCHDLFFFRVVCLQCFTLKITVHNWAHYLTYFRCASWYSEQVALSLTDKTAMLVKMQRWRRQ